jgi:hypothetical protein
MRSTGVRRFTWCRQRSGIGRWPRQVDICTPGPASRAGGTWPFSALPGETPLIGQQVLSHKTRRIVSIFHVPVRTVSCIIILTEMLGDIVKLIELVLRTIKDTPASRKPKIGKKLKSLLLDLDHLVNAGQALLSARNHEVLARDLLKVLRSKQAAIQSVLQHVSDTDLIGSVSVFLPEFRGLRGLLHAKRAGVAFMLSQLVRRGTSDGEDLERRIDRVGNKDGLARIRRDAYEGRYEGYKGSYNLSAFLYEPAMPLEKLDESLWDYGDRVSTVFATDQEAEAFRAILVRLAELRDDLRTFITREFKIEELS